MIDAEKNQQSKYCVGILFSSFSRVLHGTLRAHICVRVSNRTKLMLLHFDIFTNDWHAAVVYNSHLAPHHCNVSKIVARASEFRGVDSSGRRIRNRTKIVVRIRTWKISIECVYKCSE